ncbi:5'-flap endonuclease [Naganishia cerealis]|uniref:5'-flap endonuclease n=1 Tax=Naganishia cerealis TaxID=610337 RepID=A0ACC2VSE4_9TREE|nr:5'-flap endonuclease [Naganishia cerealis]
MSNDVYFESIHMQLNYEEFETQAQERENISKILTSLSKFRKMSPKSTRSFKVKSAPLTNRKARNRIKSINAHVSAQYKVSNGQQNDDILDFFLKRKHNISSILEGVEDLENRNIVSNDTPQPSDNTGNYSSQLFTQEEWFQILRRIKLRFPKLSARTRKSLKYVTTKLEHLKNINSDDDLPQLWTQAASLPEEGLVNEDMKWLYELDDEQMDIGSSFCNVDEDSDQKLFVLTLSQAMGEREKSEPDVEIILDSSPEPTQLLNDGIIEEEHEVDEEEEDNENEEKSEKQLASLPTQILLDDTQEQLTNRAEISSYEALSLFPNTLETQKQPVKSTIQKQASVVVPDYPKILNVKDEEIILSSSPTRDNEIFQTPRKYSVESVRSSPSLRSGRLGRLMVSPLKLLLPDRLDASQSVYSTARSSPTKQKRVRGREVNEKIVRKRFKTSRVEVAGNFHLKASDDLKIVSTVDKVNGSEVEDSEDDDHSVSIIEITHEVNDEELKAVDEEVTGEAEDGPSIIQVPSSPGNENLQEDLTSMQTSIASVTQEVPSNYTATQMRQALRLLDFPPERSKEGMALLLTRAASIAGTSVLLLLTPDAPYEEVKNQIYSAISELVKKDQLWHERVLSYEPIVLEEFKQWLGELDKDLKFDVTFLQQYCDHMGITTTIGTTTGTTAGTNTTTTD